MNPDTETRQYPYDRLAAGLLPLLEEHRRAATLLAGPAPLSSLGEISKVLRIAFLLAYARLADRVPPRVKTVSGWLPLFPGLVLPAAVEESLPVLDSEDPPATAKSRTLPGLILGDVLSLAETLMSYGGEVAGYEPQPPLDRLPEGIENEVIEAMGMLSALPRGGDVSVFGSRATGTAREDSDIDVAIVYPDSVLSEQSVRRRGRVEFHLLRESDLKDPTNLLAQGMLSANIPMGKERP